jgi:hypothetical protein
MAIIIEEKKESRQWVNGECTWWFVAKGSSDDAVVKAALLSAAPTTYQGLVRDNDPQVDPVAVDRATGRGVWNCRVRYKRVEKVRPQIGASTYTFDTGGGTERIIHSKATLGAYAGAGPGAPLFGNVGEGQGGGGIGFNGQGFDGVEIVVPKRVWSETHELATSIITQEYIDKVEALTGCYNNATFRGKAVVEVMFLGGSGTVKAGTESTSLTFKFTSSPNKANIKIGDFTVDTKLGWHYLWVLYDKAVSNSHMVARPRAAYVDRVSDPGDFSQLAIGT